MISAQNFRITSEIQSNKVGNYPFSFISGLLHLGPKTSEFQKLRVETPPLFRQKFKDFGSVFTYFGLIFVYTYEIVSDNLSLFFGKNCVLRPEFRTFTLNACVPIKIFSAPCVMPASRIKIVKTQGRSLRPKTIDSSQRSHLW